MNIQSLKGPSANDQYVDIAYLAKGGMSELYTGTDSVTQEVVAIKIIRVSTHEERTMLETEFKIAKSLNHPNIIKTYYSDEYSDVTGNYFYCVMEYAKNGSLRKVINSALTPLPIETCVKYFTDILNGLSEAHKYIVHRDLKPENILIGDNGELKICDFGISKYVDMLTRSRTRKGWGTYAYMSPECWLNRPNSPKMDIYSLGIIFFEILSLKLPFEGPTDQDFKEQHLYGHIPDILSIRPDIPIGFAEVITKMTNKDPYLRFSSAIEILNVLHTIDSVASNTSPSIQNIIRTAHERVIKDQTNDLEIKRMTQAEEDKNKFNRYAIQSLFNQFDAIVETVKQQLINTTILPDRNINPNALASIYSIKFYGYLTISFRTDFDPDIYSQGKREQYYDSQQRTYGMVMNDYTPDYIERDNIQIIGRVVTERRVKEKAFGFNIILIKHSPDDVYGRWYYCKFFDQQYGPNSAPDDFYYPLDPPEFYRQYSYARENVRWMESKLLSDEVIASLISSMPQYGRL